MPSQLEQHTLRILANRLSSRKGQILHFFGFIVYFSTFKVFFLKDDNVTQLQLNLSDESSFIIFSGYRIVLFCFQRKSLDPYNTIIKNNITFNIFVLLTIMLIIAIVMIMFNCSDYFFCTDFYHLTRTLRCPLRERPTRMEAVDVCCGFCFLYCNDGLCPSL